MNFKVKLFRNKSNIAVAALEQIDEDLWQWKVLLDANAYSALLHDRSEVAERVRKAERVLLSTIVVGELIFGFRNGTRFQQNFVLLESFLANRYVKLVPVTFTKTLVGWVEHSGTHLKLKLS